MKIVAINGSPHKKWNTDALLAKILESAASKGAEMKMVDLYDLKISGCKKLYGAQTQKRKEPRSLPLKDELTTILEEIHDETDAVVIGSPIYWHEVTGVTRCFLELFLFQYLNDDDPDSPFRPKLKDLYLTKILLPLSTLVLSKTGKSVVYNPNA